MKQPQSLNWLGPLCPECGELAGVSRMFWGLGKPFECLSCGTELVISKGRNGWLGAAAFIAYWRAQLSHDGLQLFALFMVIVFGLLLLSWVTLSPKQVSPELRD